MSVTLAAYLNSEEYDGLQDRKNTYVGGDDWKKPELAHLPQTLGTLIERLALSLIKRM